MFLECFACLGGCINGPGGTWEEPGLLRRNRVEAYTPTYIGRPGASAPAEVRRPGSGEDDLKNALRRVGKNRPEDEVNCGGAAAGRAGSLRRPGPRRAELEMCVIHMRNQAQKKANALLRTMPSGVVIVGPEPPSWSATNGSPGSSASRPCWCTGRSRG